MPRKVSSHRSSFHFLESPNGIASHRIGMSAKFQFIRRHFPSLPVNRALRFEHSVFPSVSQFVARMHEGSGPA
jgi:hypothetical protein